MKQDVRIHCVGLWDDWKSNYLSKTLSPYYNFIMDDNDPDFIICSMFGQPYEYLKYSGVRIFVSGEPYEPDFNYYDYATGTSKIFFGDRYCWNPIHIGVYKDEVKKLVNRRKVTKDELLKKKKFCNFIYSHERDDFKRKIVYEALNKYKKVDALGPYLNNSSSNKGTRVNYRDKVGIQSEYKFTVSLESGNYTDFFTEKITDAFFSYTIPIYDGDPNICETFNKRAFINCADFKTIDDVIRRVIEIDSNDELYLDMVNEPVFNEAFNPEEKFDEFLSFFGHIFSQPRDMAYRRIKDCSVNTVYEVERYRRHMLFYNKIIDRKSVAFAKRVWDKVSNKKSC